MRNSANFPARLRLDLRPLFYVGHMDRRQPRRLSEAEVEHFLGVRRATV